jgi:hypothetical protein
VIQLGILSCLLPEAINFLDADDILPRAILVGRIMYFGWLGGYIYSLNVVVRRFIARDLKPDVFYHLCARFYSAINLGTIVGAAIGMLGRMAGTPFHLSLGTACVVSFFVGFFPERGLDWLTITAQKALKQPAGVSKEIRLSEIEGLSIWHQARLKQEGIENAQNLASVDVADLVIHTPFAATEIIDWIDQAILLVHTSRAQFQSLAEAGLIRASDVLANTCEVGRLQALSTAGGLEKEALEVLHLSLRSALNADLVLHFRGQSSLALAQATSSSPASEPDAGSTLNATATETAADVRITYIECNPAGDDPEGEYVELENLGLSAADMNAGTLSDRADHTYTFPRYTLNAGATVRVWTKAGVDGARDLYWGSGSAVWNNTGDTAALRDEQGTVIHTYGYPEEQEEGTSA